MQRGSSQQGMIARLLMYGMCLESGSLAGHQKPEHQPPLLAVLQQQLTAAKTFSHPPPSYPSRCPWGRARWRLLCPQPTAAH
jgi:hypothetical protein